LAFFYREKRKKQFILNFLSKLNFYFLTARSKKQEARSKKQEARIWIYQSGREFVGAEVEKINEHLKQFAEKWVSHQQQLIAHGEVLHGRFIVLMVDDVQGNGASGCSIDTSVKFIQELGKAYNTDLFNRLEFAYFEEGTVKVVHKTELPDLLANGVITEKTLFFDNLVKNKGELKERWMVPLKDSWHRRFAG